MLSKIKNFWNKYGFETVIAICITLILMLAVYNIISGKKGTWCNSVIYSPYVKRNKGFVGKKQKQSSGEIECRRYLEDVFKKPFKNSRPDFLRNPVTGGNFNLELDCYNPQLKLAVEYNGAQHYKFIPHFHKNKEAFLNQKYRDDMKRRMCEDNGVYLIEVPYTVKVQNINIFLQKELEKRKYI